MSQVANTALIEIGVVEGVTIEIALTEFRTAGPCGFPEMTLLVDATGYAT